MIVGANSMQRAVQVPSALITALNGLVVVFVVSSEIFRRRLANKREMEELRQVSQVSQEERTPV
jgi:simple sugar transport system permease protein